MQKQQSHPLPSCRNAGAAVGIIVGLRVFATRARVLTNRGNETGGTMIKTMSAIALAGTLAACTVGRPATPTAGGVEGGSSGALIGCLVTIPIGCAPGAVVGTAAGGTLGATGHAVAAY